MGSRGRPTKEQAQRDAEIGWGPLRQYWQAINRHEKTVTEQKRARRKQTDKARPKCRCEAYPWPHRPAGGLCLHPDPPLERWKRKYDWKYRPHRDRYTGLRLKLARACGLHPIRDRQILNELMPRLIESAKQIKAQNPRIKFQNMYISHFERTPHGYHFTLTGNYQTAGPHM